MWFCCQVWKCNLKTCLGSLEVWKAWNGWGHVVYPSKTTSTSKNFGERPGDDHGKQSVFLHRQLSLRNGDQSHSSFSRLSDEIAGASTEAEPGNERRSSSTLVTVEIHHGSVDEKESSFRHGRGSSRIRHNSAGSSVSRESSRGSVRSSGGGSIRRDRRAIAPPEHQVTPPASPRESPLGSPRRTSSTRRDPRSAELKSQDSKGSHHGRSPLGVVLEWEVERDGDPPRRAPSTEWTPLETSLDFWRREHTRQSLRRNQPEDDERCSKVRYNDTGSLEEVNVEDIVDYYVEDEDIMEPTERDRDSLRLQYRRLWELRATLEEDDELSDPEQVVELNRSSPDQSPEQDQGTSYTTSFESNTEPLLADDPSRWPPHLLPLPSYESRRQSYKNILTSRLRRMEPRPTGQRPPTVENNSFDSVETVDTEGSSTDASRLEQVTTSFESTTDNTDSTGDSQAHKLQQIRADSGYKSFENTVPPKLSRKQIHFVASDSAELEELVGGEGEAEREIEMEMDLEDEGVSLQSSPPTETPPPWDKPLRHKTSSNNRSASKKRREFGRERQNLDKVFIDSVNEFETDSKSDQFSGAESHDELGMLQAVTTGAAAGTTVVTPGSRSANKTVLLSRYLRYNRYNTIYTARDYSVDEKSDALFREFSRCDPVYEQDSRGRQRFHYRRLHHRHHPEHEPAAMRRKLSPQDSIDEEYVLPYSSSGSRDVEEEAVDVHHEGLPVIRVAGEDTSNIL